MDSDRHNGICHPCMSGLYYSYGLQYSQRTKAVLRNLSDPDSLAQTHQNLTTVKMRLIVVAFLFSSPRFRFFAEDF